MEPASPYHDDAALMRGLAAGESSAAQAAMRLYLSPVLALARRLLRDASEAEDVAQESFTRLWQQAENWQQSRGSVKAWLLTIALNLCRDRLRKKRPTPLADLADMPDYPDPAPSAFARTAAAQNWQLFEAAWAQLPEKQQSALLLLVFHRLSYKEIAAMLELRPRSVESLIARARKTLRLHMAEPNPMPAMAVETKELSPPRPMPTSLKPALLSL